MTQAAATDAPRSGPLCDVTGGVCSAENLCVKLDGVQCVVDDEIEFTIAPGEVLGLVGESGSGKTCVATALLGFERRGAYIAGGRIVIDDKEILGLSSRGLRSMRGSLVSYVPQDPSMSLNPALRIETQLMEVLRVHDFGANDGVRRARLEAMMNEVRLPCDHSFLRRYPHQLSGGQQQRVILAMALACRPKLIVLDEPTTGLDVTTQAHVLRTVRDLTDSYGVGALYVTHDLAVVANLTDRIAVMYAGRLVEVGTRDELLRAAAHPYTRKLLAAVPDLSGERLPAGIPGRAPLPGQRPEGCSFWPRCEWADDRCRQHYPSPEGPPEHRVRCWKHREVSASPVLADRSSRPISLRGRAEEEPLLVVRGLTVWHGRREILHGVECQVHQGRCLALVGESGSGKTTLARAVAGIHRGRIQGEITLDGAALQRESRSRPKLVRQAIQYVFQSPYASLNPRKTVGQIVEEPLRTLFKLSAGQIQERTGAALEHVLLDTALLPRYPEQLSGGERQRVAIARALVAEPRVLVCDEVTSALDVSVQAMIVEILARLIEETGVAIVFVTHHLPLVYGIADEVAVMHEGRIVEDGCVGDVLASPQADYTRRLLSDTPTLRSTLV